MTNKRVTIYTLDAKYNVTPVLHSALVTETKETYKFDERLSAFGYSKVIEKTKYGVNKNPKQLIQDYIETQEKGIVAYKKQAEKCNSNIEIAQEFLDHLEKIVEYLKPDRK